ncbi:hypothetical protein LAPL110952_05530 [Lactiplantibacillus plajomi]
MDTYLAVRAVLKWLSGVVCVSRGCFPTYPKTEL